MSKARQLRWLFLLVMLSACSFRAFAQQVASNPWDVLGNYTCTTPGGDEPSKKLFLLPDMRWDRVAPFTFEPFRLTWVRVQTRGWIGRVPYAFKPNGTFKVQSGVVELYNTELVEDPYTGHFGVNGFLWGTTKNLDRPSVLPEPRPQPVWARLLVQRFRFDLNSGQLTEVLPVGSGRNPFSCDKLPLFAADRY